MAVRSRRWAAVAACVACSCGSVVALSVKDESRLKSSSDIPVVYVKSTAPWVYCPGDLGRATWMEQGAVEEFWMPPGPVASAWRQAAFAPASYGGPGTFVRVGDFWEDYEEQETKPLRIPPEDPARATARRFLAIASAEQNPIPFRTEAAPVPEAYPAVLTKLYGPGPILVFQTSEWVLVGCFSTYSPWFSVQGQLVDTTEGRVLWRASCGGEFPTTFDWHASDLAAHGGARYARIIDERAAQCSRDLFASLALARGDRAGASDGEP